MIVAAAIKTPDKVWTLPRPKRHDDIIRAMVQAGASARRTGACQGFVNSEGEFLTRGLAAQEAFICGQLPGKAKAPPILMTEDLW